MIPLILIALGLGAALTAYEFSPRARARIDDYARAIRAAHDAHRAADEHLIAADQHVQLSSDPLHASAAVARTVSAMIDNQAAAQRTADAAKVAASPAEKAVVADSAAQVLAREKQIADNFANLGVGECDMRTYPRVSQQKRDELLAKLHAEGMTVTGDNPWDIDTSTVSDATMRNAKVKLRAAWNPGTQVLRLIVTSSAWYVPCSEIWKRIDPKVRGIIGT